MCILNCLLASWFPSNEEMIAAYLDLTMRGSDLRTLMGKTLGSNTREHSTPEFPASIFYAYKQEEEERGGRTSTGWDTMLSALVSAGFQIVGTWPMRTERSGRSNALNANSLASSVVLVCRIRSSAATSCHASGVHQHIESRIAVSFAPDAVRQHWLLWIWPRRPSVLVWQCSLVTPRCWMLVARAVSVRDAIALINRGIG